MSKIPQKEILLNYLWKVLKDNIYLKDQWVVSYNIIKINTPFGWLGTAADALARKLRKEGLIESKDIGQYTYFRITDKGIGYIYNKQKSLGLYIKEPIREAQGRLL